MVSGIAMSTMCSGFDDDGLALEDEDDHERREQRRDRDRRERRQERLLEPREPLAPDELRRARPSPSASGTTTKSTTDRMTVSHGHDDLRQPSRNITIGAKATRMIRSFTATCTSV